MIAVNEPLLGERELEYITECVRSSWISSAGHYIEEFEEKWAAYCGMKNGIAVSNGTTALQVVEGIARQGLYLPSELTMNEEQLEDVCKAVIVVLG